MKIPLKMQKGKLLGFYGRRLAWLFAMVISVQALCAQTQTITGTVSDATGETLPGASVQVVGSSTGTMTDLDGKFTIQAASNAQLRISYTSFVTQTISVAGKTVINVTLQEDRKVLDEVVVTALGISREAKSLSYARQAVNTESMSEVRASNLLDMLSGKAAGMQVIPGGGPLASTRIVIRGNNSLSGNNQPLYVVDGMPIEANEVGDGGLDFGSPINSINPDEIENIEILKGANASALYGSAAANGVVLITTKKASEKPGLGISYGYNMMFGTLYNFPTYQNIFGRRFNTGEAANVYGLNRNGWTYQQDFPYGIYMPGATNQDQRSWGLPMLGFDVVGLNEQIRAYNPQPNNIRDMFQTSTAITNSVSMDKVIDQSTSFRFSYTNVNQDDIIKNLNNLDRHNFNIRATTKLGNIVDVDASIRYMYEAVDRRNYRGNTSSKNPFSILANMPRDVSTSELIPWKREDGMAYTYNGFMNPYWALYEIDNADSRHDFSGNLQFNIKLPYDLQLRLRAATSFNNQNKWEFSNLGSSDEQGDGRYSERSEEGRSVNGEALLSYNKRFGENVSLSANAGFAFENNKNSNMQAVVDQLMKYDWRSLYNRVGQYRVDEGMYHKQKQGAFAMASLGLYDWLFFEGTLRNDWSSTLPKQNNSYLYYSLGTSIILTDALKIDKEILSFAKLRASYADVGNDTGYNRLRAFYNPSGSTYHGLVYYQGDALRQNPLLKPETTLSFEIGTDLRFFDNRLALDFTYYDKRTVDQIVEAPAPYASGYDREIINSGEVRNRGIELSLSYTPVRTNMVTWTTTLNGASNRTKVLSLPRGQEFIYRNGNGEPSLRTISMVGQSYSVFYGTDFKYTPDGRVRVMADGRPIEDTSQLKILGTIEPDMVGGWINTLRIGQFDFGAMIDFQVGGLVHSQTAYRGGIDGQTVQSLTGRTERFWSQWVLGENDEERRGLLKPENTVTPGATATPTMDNSNYVLYPDWERPKGVQQPGAVYDDTVLYFGEQYNDANGNGQKDEGEQIWNESIGWVNPEDYWTHGAKRNLNYIYDASYIKLRELSVGYNVPLAWLKNTPIRTARLMLVARNVAILHQETPRGMDPQATASTGNDQGFEKGFNLPQANYGFDIKVTF